MHWLSVRFIICHIKVFLTAAFRFEFLLHVYSGQCRQTHCSSFWLAENVWINQSAALFLFGSGTVTDWLIQTFSANQLLCFCLAVEQSQWRERNCFCLTDNTFLIIRRGQSTGEESPLRADWLFDCYLRLCILAVWSSRPLFNPIRPVKRLSHG